MKETDYYKSGAHSDNARKAGDLARIAQTKAKEDRRVIYSQNPSRCTNEQCGNALDFLRRTEKFCSRSCAAVHNMAIRKADGWTHSQKSKDQTSSKLVGRVSPNKGVFGDPKRLKERELRNCQVCNAEYKVLPSNAIKTCGKAECTTHLKIGNRTYQNGKRKLIHYYNKWEDKEVILESSWELELAEWLDENNIHWVRPKYLKWVDSTGKNRMYYPDFYVPSRDVYLDPKNPYCIEQDREKLAYFVDKVTLHYGSVENIIMDFMNE